MKRRNFIKLAAMAAVAAVLPKSRPAIKFPAEPRPADWRTHIGVDWGTSQFHTALAWFGTPIESSLDLPLDRVYFVKRNA